MRGHRPEHFWHISALSPLTAEASQPIVKTTKDAHTFPKAPSGRCFPQGNSCLGPGRPLDKRRHGGAFPDHALGFLPSLQKLRRELFVFCKYLDSLSVCSAKEWAGLRRDGGGPAGSACWLSLLPLWERRRWGSFSPRPTPSPSKTGSTSRFPFLKGGINKARG